MINEFSCFFGCILQQRRGMGPEDGDGVSVYLLGSLGVVVPYILTLTKRMDEYALLTLMPVVLSCSIQCDMCR